MSGLVCITNSIDEIRSCTFKGQHVSTCDGYQHRWNHEHRFMEITERECAGCMPRPAEHGLFCATCWEQVVATMRRKDDSPTIEALDLITHLRSIETSTSGADGIRSAPGSRMIVPQSWIAADQLYLSLANTAVQFADDWKEDEPEWDVTASLVNGFHPEAPIEAVWHVTEMLIDHLVPRLDRLSTKHKGAGAMIAFVREFQRADRLFPREMKARPIKWVKCRECNRSTLEFKPPLQLNEPRVVKCTNLACQAVWDPATVDFDVRMIREELERPIGLSDYPRTSAEMTDHGIEPNDVPVVTIDRHGYQLVYHRGRYKGKFSAHIPWPTGCNAWARFEEERDYKAMPTRELTNL